MKNSVKLKGRLKTYMQYSIYLGIVLALVDIGVFLIDVRAGLLLLAFTVFYFAIVAFMLLYNRPIILNELISFATHYGQIQKRLLRELELPHALLDESGKIVWTNKAFEDLVHKPKGYNKSITSIFSTVTREKLPGANGIDETEMNLEFEEGNYTMKMKKIPLREMAENSDIIEAKGYDGYLIALYMFDNTALRIALKEVDDQSLCVGMIYIDNYEEALESVEEVRRSLLTALIDRKINKYISSIDGIARKIEKDKFLIVLRKKSALQLQEMRFDILDDVKTVSIGNEMAVTVSIGLGYDGLTYAQNCEFARNAIDLALGRGGDQAVVKTPQNIVYYGGKSQQVEKNTRVKARVKAHALKEIITAKDEVIIMGHRLADVDSFGAAVGIYRIAKTLERKAHIVLNDVTTSVKPLVDLFEGNPDYDDDMIVTGQEALDLAERNSVLVVVDVNKPSITECPELLKVCKSIVVLDHHRQGSETIENATLSYVEAYASSACEMVSEILQYIYDNIKITNEEADCMYSGIMIDTNNFMTKTGVRTFEAAAYLRKKGANTLTVKEMFSDSIDTYKEKVDIVCRANIYKNCAVSTSKNTKDGVRLAAAQAADEMLTLQGVSASFVVYAENNRVNISARSYGRLNVQVIMEKLGGGGHQTMAATQLENTTITLAYQQLLSVIDSTLDEMSNT